MTPPRSNVRERITIIIALLTLCFAAASSVSARPRPSAKSRVEVRADSERSGSAGAREPASEHVYTDERKPTPLSKIGIDSENMHIISVVDDRATNSTAARLLGDRFNAVSSLGDYRDTMRRAAGPIFVIAHIEDEQIVARDASGAEQWRMPLVEVAALERELAVPVIVLGCQAGKSIVSGSVGFINTVDAIEQLGKLHGTMSALSLLQQVAGDKFHLSAMSTTVHALESHQVEITTLGATSDEGGSSTQIRVIVPKPGPSQKQGFQKPEEGWEGLRWYTFQYVLLFSIAAAAYFYAERISKVWVSEVIVKTLLLLSFACVEIASYNLDLFDNGPLPYYWIAVALFGWFAIIPLGLIIPGVSQFFGGGLPGRKSRLRPCCALGEKQGHLVDHGVCQDVMWTCEPTTNFVGGLRSIETATGLSFRRGKQDDGTITWVAERALSPLSRLEYHLEYNPITPGANLSLQVRHRTRVGTLLVLLLVSFNAGRYIFNDGGGGFHACWTLTPMMGSLLLGLCCRHWIVDSMASARAAISPSVEVASSSSAPQCSGGVDDPPTGRPFGQGFTALEESDTPMRFVCITGGEFSMGANADDADASENESPRHRVRVAPFWIADAAVTVAQYEDIAGNDPTLCTDPRGPINNITWGDAIRFCNALSQREGLRPCYIGAGDHWRLSSSGNGFRLPTEEEWEYACRAGGAGIYGFGSDVSVLPEHAWFVENSDGSARPVAMLAPNRWGLFDMHGNVWEWCWGVACPYSSKENSGGTEGAIIIQPGDRVVRGGAANTPAVFLRSSCRNVIQSSTRSYSVGFRCVRSWPPRD